jgi:hypothetical protein
MEALVQSATGDEFEQYFVGNWQTTTITPTSLIALAWVATTPTLESAGLCNDKHGTIPINNGFVFDGTTQGPQNLQTLAQHIWPYTVAPGIFQSHAGIFGRFTTETGAVLPGARVRKPGAPPQLGSKEHVEICRSMSGNVCLACPAATSVQSVLPASTSSITPIEIDLHHELDRGFRMDLLGDLIRDCGHPPFPTEIHPPRAILLHLARVDESVARYSVFGWNRAIDTEDPPLIVDLWPNRRAFIAGFSLGASPVPFQSFRGVIKMSPETAGTGDWLCKPYPDAAPSRIRCTLQQGPVGSTIGAGQCTSDRMVPGCANAIGGGLVDVKWGLSGQ